MLLEGKNSVSEALNSDVTVEKVLVLNSLLNNPLVEKIKASGVKYQFVERSALDRISKTHNHQGFIAYATNYEYVDVDEIIEAAYRKGEQPLIVILDGVEDPHNLGSILRVCECAGVSGVIIPKNRAATINETVIKVSAGAASIVKVAKVTNINQEIEKLKEKGVWVYAAEAGGTPLNKTNLKGPLAIVMGGENSGVKALTKKLCDGVVSIPMYGKINSLNVATATSVVLYEACNQRRK
ncbi:MAG: 23S rRNA (guanosine(2251)-2'-O)-methyltransferase RlmB [Firmicutes bacterium]|nr:23S rRNA (guanosine(2251)-2'-O)-methyltransferase RlmB [Bacillota bacterium]